MLEVNTVKQVKMENKINKSILDERENFTKPSSLKR